MIGNEGRPDQDGRTARCLRFGCLLNYALFVCATVLFVDAQNCGVLANFGFSLAESGAAKPGSYSWLVRLPTIRSGWQIFSDFPFSGNPMLSRWAGRCGFMPAQ
jgi:hypothetical protein